VTRTARPRSDARTGREPVGTQPGRAIQALAIVLAIGVLLPLGSTLLSLYEHVTNWGKFVHALDGASATLIFGLLLLGWRDRVRAELTDELATLTAIFGGILFGVLWEIVEFVRDWVASSDLEKSNTDTMTDFLCNDVAVVIAALVAMQAYCHLATARDRAALGQAAEGLVDGPSRVLDRHGLALALIAAGLIGAAVLVLWFAGRPVPGLPIP
jgi:hypothetical protein